MRPVFAIGELVQTPLGKGVVREIRNHGRLLVDVNGRAVEFDAAAVKRPDAKKAPRTKLRAPAREPVRRSTNPVSARGEVDLHGLTVEEALTCAETAINDALLADLIQLRLIHGQSGGRIRASLHRRLRDIPTVRAFRLDPRNAGVTIVTF